MMRGFDVNGVGSPTSSQGVSSLVLIDSTDVAGSIGRPGFLPKRLRSNVSNPPDVEVRVVPGGRCDVVAQRFVPEQPSSAVAVAAGLESWFNAMVEPYEIPGSTAMLALSMVDAVMGQVWRHHDTGILVQPPLDRDMSWTAEQNSWLERDFEPVPPSDDHLESALRSIAERLEPLGAEFVVFNVSTFIPDENVRWFAPDEPETIAVRANRIDLIVERLIGDLNITLVDVDRVMAELGARDAVMGIASYTPGALEVLAEEAMAVISNLPGISRDFASDTMQLTVPRYDRRTTSGTIVRWHVTEGETIDGGDLLFDVRFENLHSRLKNNGQRSGKVISMSVVAAREGFVDQIMVDAGASVTVGTRVAVITTRQDIEWSDDENAAQFPIGVKLERREDE